MVADCLSRPSASTPLPSSQAVSSSSRPLADPPGLITGASSPPSPAVIDWRGVASRQATCTSVQHTAASPSLKVVARHQEGVQLLCDISTGHGRPLIPTEDRQSVFEAIHNVAHPGTRATRRLVSARVVWRGMASDLAAWCRACQQCQRAKVTKQPAAPVQPIPIPQRQFSHVHVDLVGPLLLSPLKASPTSSPSSTGRPGGWKLCCLSQSVRSVLLPLHPCRDGQKMHWLPARGGCQAGRSGVHL